MHSLARISPEDLAKDVAAAQDILKQHHEQLGATRQERLHLSKVLGDVQVDLAGVRSEVDALTEQLRVVSSRAEVVGLPPKVHRNELMTRYTKLEELRQAIAQLIAEQERDHLIQESANLRARHSILEDAAGRMSKALTRLEDFQKVASAAIEEASKAARARVHETIQSSLAALYPHRHLDRLILRGGELLLTDDLLKEGVDPELYSSSGQLNTVALALFLGSSALQNISRLRVVMLDEPVQSLDDVHFLAFASLLKRLATSRQVIVSTADSNVAELLARQFRSSLGIGPDFTHYEWTDFDCAAGPQIRRRSTSIEDRHTA